MDDGVDPIFLIDEIDLRSDSVDALLASFRTRYLPGARERGMELVHTLVTPPEGPTNGEATLLLFWKISGIAGFWAMRSANATPEIAEFWRECDALCIRRTRRFAVEADARGGFTALGRASG